MKIAFTKPGAPKKGAVVVFADNQRKAPKLLPRAQAFDKTLGGAITRALSASRFKGNKGQSLVVMGPGKAIGRVIVIGLGKAGDITALGAEKAGGAAMGQLLSATDKNATVIAELPKGCKLTATDMAAHVGVGARLRSYRFDKYRTREKKEDKPSLARVEIQVSATAAAGRKFRALDAVADGVFFTRDLVSEPANVIYPETLAREARKLSRLGVRVEVLDEKKMKQLGFGALLGVGQGSARPPRLVIMRWNGAKGKKGKAAQPVAFVGKGVTFDTGGISIKPSRGMEDMKWDMAGAGVVIGLMRALAGRKARVNAIGIVGLVENMPSGRAQRPGDIVKSYSGQTVEVLNTDAEGRLVLADALWYCQKRFKPQFMVNLATLTGAIIVALGHHHAGLFSNNDKLADRLTAAGQAMDEKLWRLPLSKDYDKQMDSKVADVQNISSGGGAGSITAAQFLQRFVNKVPWAHIDIAGVTWSNKDAPTVPRGGTAFGVRLLDRLVADHYES